MKFISASLYLSVIGILAITTISTSTAEDAPTYCNCVLAAFCPNYGEGSIRPREDNVTRAECPEGHKFCCINVQPETTLPPSLPPPCGIQRSSRVPGFNSGPTDLANFGEFPWLVRIIGPNGKFLGSGALIGESTVITVAHIFQNRHPSYVPEKVILGEWNDAVNVRPYTPVEKAVKKLLIHHHYNPHNLRNDIAIIHLSYPVNLEQNPNIGTACLPRKQFENHRCFLSTYGDDEFPIVRKIELPIVPSSSCESTFKKTILGRAFILDSNSFVCAGGEPGKDACKGHGGAPLACRFNDHFEIAGLVSWGLTDDFCGGGNVYNYYNWITENLG